MRGRALRDIMQYPGNPGRRRGSKSNSDDTFNDEVPLQDQPLALALESLRTLKLRPILDSHVSH